MSEIDNIELVFLNLEDYQELKEAMIQAYATMPDAYWREKQIDTLINSFPEGQVVIKVNGLIAGVALSIIVDYDKFDDKHTFRDIIGNYTFKTHSNLGNILYGIEIFVRPKYRGLRLARRLYDYRKELCEKLNFKKKTSFLTNSSAAKFQAPQSL